MSYVEHMQRVATGAFDELYRGIEEVHFTDFPDYSNVGDSAIALGQLDYFRQKQIAVRSIQSFATIGVSMYESKVPVMLNGGGNLGGLYPVLDDHRFELASRLRQGTTLIQSPQSVQFVDSKSETRFRESFASRPGIRIGVRDQASLEKVVAHAPLALLAPDAVHFLGEIESNNPTVDVLVLARSDNESQEDNGASDLSNVDWLVDGWKPRALTFLRLRARRLPQLAHALNPRPASWELVANARLRRGTAVLSEGETIVTDRLHAMLIGLQMGRRVIAVDNNNSKLSSYAKTWFGETSPDLRFAHNFTEAFELANNSK